MTLKERIEEAMFMDDRYAAIYIRDLYPILDTYIAEKIQEMEEMKHKNCMENTCLVNDTISACQKIIHDEEVK